MTAPSSQFKVPKYHPIAVLGLPITNCELSDLVDLCLETIKNNKQRFKVSYFSLIHGELASECYGWLPTTVNNPELLAILRKTSLSSASGKFLTRLANLLGSKTSPEFSFREFVFTLSYALAENENGIFILASDEKEAKSSAISLHDMFPKLRLVGIAAPPLFTEGEDIVTAYTRDALLIEQINSSNAEVLFISLGPPKQMIWLDRVRRDLVVPLIITTDGPLNLLKKELHKPPASQDERSYFDNISEEADEYFKSIKLACLAAPLFIFHTLNRYLYQWFYAKKNLEDVSYSQLFISSNRTIAIITLPECLDQSNQSELKQVFDNAANHDVFIFDFHKVRHIQPEGFYLLIKAWMQRNSTSKIVYGYSVTSDIEWLMKLQRTWDVFKNSICDSLEDLLYRLSSQEGGEAGLLFYDTFSQGQDQVTISLLGSLNNTIDYDAYLKKVIPTIGQKDCCINFAYCNYVENLGISFLLNLRKQLQTHSHTLRLSSVSPHLRKQLQLAKTDKLFIIN